MRHPDELCDNGCFECRDMSNGGEMHCFDLDAGGHMRVIEYRNSYAVAIVPAEGFAAGVKTYSISKESWRFMLAEEAHEWRQSRGWRGGYP